MANQPRNNQPFRLWPWNPSPARPRATGKASSSKLPQTTAPAPSKPPPKWPSSSLPISTTPRDEDPMPIEIFAVQLAPEDEQKLLPSQRSYELISPLPASSSIDKVSRQTTLITILSPRGSRREDQVATTVDISSTPSQDFHRPQQSTLTQEVSSQIPTTLQTEIHEKKINELKSPTHRQEDEQKLPPSQKPYEPISPLFAPSSIDKVPRQTTLITISSPRRSRREDQVATTIDVSSTPSQDFHRPQQPALTQEVSSQTPTTLQTEMHEKKTKEPKSPTHRQEDEQKLPPSQRPYEPISPLPALSPIDKVPRQTTPPATVSSPGGSRREDQAVTTADISPTPAQDVHRPQQPTLTQKVSSQTPTTLQTEMYEKKTKEPKSPTHRQEDEQKLSSSQRPYEPISPLHAPSPIDKVSRQITPPATISSSGGSRREDPTATIVDISPTPSQDVHRPQQSTLTQEVSSQTPTTLQTEMHEKKTKEPKSPTHRQEDEQKLPPSQRPYEPISPLPTPSPIDKVLRQTTPPAAISSPGGSRREDPTATTADISSTPSRDVHRLQQATLTQEASSQTPTTLPTKMHEKKTKEPKSLTHQQKVLTQESQTTQPPKQVEPDSQLTEPATVPAPELGHTIETMIPTTPLTEQESKAVTEERVAYPDSVANAYTSRVQEKQEMDVEKKEELETSMHPQADGENVKEEKPTPHQQTLEGRPKHVNGESTTKDLQVTREISYPSQETKITDEKIEEKQPDAQGSKMDLEEKQQTIVDPKIPQASATRGGRDTQTENNDGNKLAQKLIFKHRQLGGSEQGISIITLAGENSGASMHTGRKTLDTARSRRGSKIEEHPSAGSKVNNKALVDTPKMKSNEVPSISTGVNSNVQSINNSLIHESSCVQEDPGVHLIFSTP